jgi:energy-converting hydrogenase B subunit Q
LPAAPLSRIVRRAGQVIHDAREDATMAERFGLTVHAEGVEGGGARLLHELTGVIARHDGEVASVDVTREGAGAARLSFELELPEGERAGSLADELRALPGVREVALVKSLQRIYGKRIIIMGGGAQVGQVAIGAISEADRHNIRGERISVDTIPLVGEQPLADAVRAVARLPRACALVLAGSIMGGDIERAVREVRAQGLLVVSLNMAGSVPEAADLVVTDPVQAGVMTVMAIAETARFSVARLKRRVF